MPGMIGPSAAGGIQGINMNLAEQATSNLKGVNPAVDPTLPRSKQEVFLNQLNEELTRAGAAAEEATEEVDMERDDVFNSEPVVMASSYFDLSKVAQMPMEQDPSMGLPPSGDNAQSFPQEGQSPELNFNTPEELKNLMDQSAEDPNFVSQIVVMAPSDSQALVKDAIQRYYEPESDMAEKTRLAADIFQAIHGRGQGEETVNATFTQASAEAIVRESLASIQRFAKESSQKITKKATSYNLKKEAQYHGNTEFINFGPESKRVFPYSNTGNIGSEWHTWVRARDHNFIFDDHAVDFETFWRGNIMDKYSRPYRNNKGEWVGGYINKRFEVDHNIPEGNNYQLLPGQRRRPYLPEFATLEARMDASRKKMAEERGYDPTDSDAKPYNWKEASSVKKK